MIPNSKAIRLPYLQLISNRKEWAFQDIIESLATHFKVSHEERMQMIPSGQKVFDYRVGYSRTIFKKANLIESTRSGFVRITQKGINFIANPNDLNKLVKHSSMSLKKPLNHQAFSKNVNFENIVYFKALGNLLQYYDSDLRYLKNFQSYRKGLIRTDDFLISKPGTFKAFLNEYGIARNINKELTKDLFELTIEWITTKDPIEVDGFANFLKTKGVTQNKTLTSLASKILFLNDPENVLPMDTRTRNSFRLKNNNYAEYIQLVRGFINQNKVSINENLNIISAPLTYIESQFKTNFLNFDLIRLNRFVDKILWTGGQD
jgi:hypothetical protein